MVVGDYVRERFGFFTLKVSLERAAAQSQQHGPYFTAADLDNAVHTALRGLIHSVA
jgi:hypothetical protein